MEEEEEEEVEETEEEAEIVEEEKREEEEEEEEEERELKKLKKALEEYALDFDEEDFLTSDPMMSLEITSCEDMISLPPTSPFKKSFSRPDSPDSGVDAGELEDVF